MRGECPRLQPWEDVNAEDAVDRTDELARHYMGVAGHPYTDADEGAQELDRSGILRGPSRR